MPHARLKDPLRGTLEFRQGQTDEDQRRAVADVTPETGTSRKPLVHVKSRTRGRSVNGLVTGQRRAQNDASTNDWEQALADYADRLEMHVDEFQGDGYTFEDDVRSLSLNAVLTGVEWRYRPREPYQLQFELDLTIGQGTFEHRPVTRFFPEINTSLAVPARVDGNSVTGIDTIELSKSMEYETKAVYDTSTAEDNDIVIDSGPVREVTIRGMQTGTESQRRSADSTFNALIGGGQVTLETRFPGYNLEGYVVDYTTRDEAERGTQSHGYELTFIEGVPA